MQVCFDLIQSPAAMSGPTLEPPAWVQSVQKEQDVYDRRSDAHESTRLVDGQSVKKGALPLAVISSIYSPVVFTLIVASYISLISFIANGQQHMDWGINIAFWTVFTTFIQLFTTIYCAYYWRTLHAGVSYPDKAKVLIFSTASALMFFRMSLDVYFIQSYAKLYDTNSVVDTFAQRQFDAFFNLVNVATVTLLPYAVFFLVENCSCRSKKEV